MEGSSKKLWGSFAENINEDSSLQNVNFDAIIELAMQHIPETPTTVKSESLQLPPQNLVTHTIALHQHARQLQSILDNTLFENARLEQLPIPPMPEEPVQKSEHKHCAPINYLDKDYCDFSLGKGPYILPLTPESHHRALKQITAILLAHVGFAESSRSALNTLTDALDHFMHTLTKRLRSAVDQEENGLSTGFSDPIQKVLTDFGMKDLHDFYQKRVVQYKSKMERKCNYLTQQCQMMVVPDMAPQLKLEDVPELHFPAALSDALTPSLETGFQMLHNLEQEELQGLELMDTVSQDDMKIDIVEFSQDTSPSSPRSKKRRKMLPS